MLNNDQPDKELSEMDELIRLCVEAAITTLEKYPDIPLISAAIMARENDIAPVMFEEGMTRDDAILQFHQLVQDFKPTSYAYAGEVRFKHISIEGMDSDQASEALKHTPRPMDDPRSTRGFAITAASSDGHRRGVTYEIIEKDGKPALGAMITNVHDDAVIGPWASMYEPDVKKLGIDQAVLHAMFNR